MWMEWSTTLTAGGLGSSLPPIVRYGADRGTLLFLPLDASGIPPVPPHLWRFFLLFVPLVSGGRWGAQISETRGITVNVDSP
mmetsp:Transcript_3020/g.6691  ORF Transcript_3020/g.6691 Transcript_3020/m.6691 type:complete len:82 (+) Transcript_3020:201-446(+)